MKNLIMIMMMVLSLAPACRAEEKLQDYDVVPLVITKGGGGQVTLNIEMAISDEAEEKGLMFRTALPKDSGMLFTFEHEDIRAFWMKNTLIPLDMIFIDKDGKIVNIHERAIPQDLTPIRSQSPANAVLEINGGRAAELGLKAGDVIHHSFFGNLLAQASVIH